MSQGLNFRIAERIAPRFYYGWTVVGVIFVANLSAFAFNPIFGLFITPLEAEFGWSRASLSLTLTFGTIFGAVMSPLLGGVYDRVGARRVMVFFSLAAAGLYVAISQANHLWQFYLFLGSVFALTVTGIAWMTTGITINRWFVRRRGRAMGIVMMAASGSAAIFLPVITFTIATAGWRGAYLVLASAMLLLITLPAFVLMIDTPEKLGLKDHPELTGPGAGSDGSKKEGEAWTLRAAVRTRAFWLVMGAIMLGNFAVQGYFIHSMPHMEAVGFSRWMASGMLTAFFMVSMAAKFGWGFLIERIGVRWGMIICFLGIGVGIQILNLARTPAMLVVYAGFNGFMQGPFLQLIAMVWADYFGRQAISRIMGVVQPAIIISGSLGVYVGGYVFDLNGGYANFFYLATGCCVMSAGLFLICRPPRQAVLLKPAPPEPA